MPDLLVIGAVGEEEFFVGAEEGRAVAAAFVPDQHGPAAGLEDAGEFFSSFGKVEPVGGLGGSG